MRYLSFLLFGLTCISCNSNTETTGAEKSDTIVQNTGPKNSSDKKTATDDGKESNNAEGNCYMQVLKRDTIVLHIHESGGNVSGKLTFDNYEKDSSTGTVKGKREGDVLKLIYSFQSEGTHSMMEVYLKEENDGVVRGAGEMQTKGDSTYFVHPKQVNYPVNGMMKKIDCQQLPDKHR